jgi:methylenetetrahydrofolate--tRNA-(uracil-5-)-methyltransferase
LPPVSGPVATITGGKLGRAVAGTSLYFYDAIAPIIDAETIDWTIAFRQSRWDRGDTEDGDYVNCPMNEAEYRAFVAEVLGGRKVTPHAFEEPKYFEGCLPIEVMAERGADVLAYGPMRPVGLTDPRTGRRPFAVVQLRPENRYGTSYNMVGFQTRLAYPDQKRVFRLIPGLANAEFLRFGSIHRNSYIDSPRLLGPELELRARPDVRFAGQITGVEGYIESCAMGLLAARFTAARLAGAPIPPPPASTALGGLYLHVIGHNGKFAPTNVNFGLLPPADEKVKKKERRAWQVARAERDLAAWL